MIRVESKTDALGALYTGLSAIASGETAREANRDAERRLQGRVDRQFQEGRDPYGQRWPTPKDGGRPGWRSGAMGRGATVVAVGSRIYLRDTQFYAAYFIRSGRLIFPTAARGLPATWRADIEAAQRNAVRRRLARAGAR